ncbi:hypothetical protein PENANT_c004G04628 [Penicillium antarcticum]|uniref:WW domain-containing protein n=1 Tax=Penicillium antarcticum TaxID=416450 RepID=A0A1V6QGG1_9EURO|nr:hypothetical protein PENANT_c004G04628 [Penicillium antarcticum]
MGFLRKINGKIHDKPQNAATDSINPSEPEPQPNSDAYPSGPSEGHDQRYQSYKPAPNHGYGTTSAGCSLPTRIYPAFPNFAALDPDSVPYPWSMQFDPSSGRTYYVNSETGESTWFPFVVSATLEAADANDLIERPTKHSGNKRLGGNKSDDSEDTRAYDLVGKLKRRSKGLKSKVKGAFHGKNGSEEDEDSSSSSESDSDSDAGS